MAENEITKFSDLPVDEAISLLTGVVVEALKPKKEKRYLTIRDVAERFGVTRQTVVTWAKTSRIPHERIGNKTLFDEESLDDCQIIKGKHRVYI